MTKITASVRSIKNREALNRFALVQKELYFIKLEYQKGNTRVSPVDCGTVYQENRNNNHSSLC